MICKRNYRDYISVVYNKNNDLQCEEPTRGNCQVSRVKIQKLHKH